MSPISGMRLSCMFVLLSRNANYGFVNRRPFKSDSWLQPLRRQREGLPAHHRPAFKARVYDDFEREGPSPTTGTKLNCFAQSGVTEGALALSVFWDAPTALVPI